MKRATKKRTVFNLKNFGRLMKKSVPLGIALAVAFNASLGVALVQHFYYRKQMSELVAYKEQLDDKLANTPEEQAKRLQAELFPEDGVVLPVKWGDLGKRLVDIGVIDKDKFMQLFKSGPLSSANNNYEAVLSGNYDDYIVLTQENSRFVLNTLWALGLAQQSKVLTDMQTQYPDVERLAATGGWSIGKKNAMEYYGQYNLFDLTPEQNELVAEIASNIYRPCCNNHTAFADCNHGMAMLGLVEMMVSEGFSEKEIYDVALQVNSVWFPDTYMTIAKYLEDKKDTEWADANSKELLGMDYSSGSGYRNVLAQVKPLPSSGGGGGCGV
jgi:hypothetical protein